MKSTVSKRGQTVVPAELRRRYSINPGTTLEWLDTGEAIRIIPLPDDLVGALRGTAKGERLMAKLRKVREGDRLREKSRK